MCCSSLHRRSRTYRCLTLGALVIISGILAAIIVTRACCRRAQAQTSAPTFTKCPKCGKRVQRDWRFCRYCGMKLSKASSHHWKPLAGKVIGDEIRNPHDGATLLWVPAGDFLMGSSDAEIDENLKEALDMKRESFGGEKPQHTVYLDGFWVYKTDVTIAQYRRFCHETGRAMPTAPAWGWNDDHPIVRVSWADASAYAEWADVGLPTEAQWEKAARGPAGRWYPWGDTWDASKCACSSTGISTTQPVGGLPAGVSPYGCMDMAGNVEQWCADWYSNSYYRTGRSRNPTGSETGVFRVLRGGGWDYHSYTHQRAALRKWDNPTNIASYRGFRCVSRSDH